MQWLVLLDTCRFLFRTTLIYFFQPLPLGEVSSPASTLASSHHSFQTVCAIRWAALKQQWLLQVGWPRFHRFGLERDSPDGAGSWDFRGRLSNISRVSAFHCPGTSLVVQWSRLHAPNAGGSGSIPVQGSGSHVPQLGPGTVKKHKQGFPWS